MIQLAQSDGATPDAPVAAPAARRESVWGVLGIGFGLLLLFGAVGLLFARRGGALDSQEVLDACFEPFDAPFGLEARPGARLPSGAKIAVLARPGSEVEDARAEVSDAPGDGKPEEGEAVEDGEEGATSETGAPGEEGEGGGGGESPPGTELEEKFDWSTLLAGLPRDSGEPPERVLVVDYPVGLAESVHARHFRRLSWIEARAVEPKGGTTTVAADKLDWNGLQALYVHARRYELRDGERRFRDLIRVCLATEDGYRVAYAFWPPGTVGSLARVGELVRALRPRKSSEDGGEGAGAEPEPGAAPVGGSD